MTNRLHTTTTKVTVEADGGRLSGFIHCDRNERGEVVGVVVLPSRRIGSLLAAWCHEASEALTAELRREPGR